MTHYVKVRDGEWFQPVRRGHLMACCDCSLVHRVDFRVVEGRVHLRAWRAPRLTARLRKDKR